jgi:nitronate monooxygenase
MPIRTPLMSRLGIERPIIQAPMAGGGDTPALVSAVVEAGGFGVIGATYLSPREIGEAARAVRARTAKPFGVNLFAPLPAKPQADAAAAVARVAPYYAELGLPPPALPASGGFVFDEQLRAALDCGAAVFSFTFGLLPADAMAAVKARGAFVMGTATTVEEAVAMEKAGVDAVVAQGGEAGGHRGTFLGPFEAGMVGTMALVPQVVDAVSVPVVAAGGIMDGRGVAAALALGAQAAQMGTAFLTTPEAGIADAYKDAIMAAREHETRVTRVFSGRPARGIANRFMDEMERSAAADPNTVLPFPLQNALTRPLRTAAAKRGRAEFLNLWAGQGLRLSRRLPAAELVARLSDETAAAIARLGR